MTTAAVGLLSGGSTSTFVAHVCEHCNLEPRAKDDLGTGKLGFGCQIV